MKKISIDKELKELCNVNLGCIFYTVEVEKENKDLWDYIENNVIPNVMNTYSLENLSEQINIKTSREAYKILGKEPSRYRVSSEALIRRILQGKGLYKINSVVDTNNLISIETGYSAGSYDLPNLQGDLVFRIGKSGENYKGIGKETINIESLPVFADELGAYGSPTSDSTRAMITENSKQILTVLISFNGMQGLEKNLNKAKEYLEKFAKAKDVEVIIV
jgi:DNA/RNA-binding domain of Phe-tRNA-synthetase-like protein